MVKLVSDRIIINKSAVNIFNFLGDFNNFEKLMPEQIINWKSTELACSFTIKGMADIGMRIEEKNHHSHIHIKSDGKVPFDFDMMFFLEAIDEEKAKVHIELEADISTMLLIMAKKPLQNLINIMISKLQDHHE